MLPAIYGGFKLFKFIKMAVTYEPLVIEGVKMVNNGAQKVVDNGVFTSLGKKLTSMLSDDKTEGTNVLSKGLGVKPDSKWGELLAKIDPTKLEKLDGMVADKTEVLKGFIKKKMG